MEHNEGSSSGANSATISAPAGNISVSENPNGNTVGQEFNSSSNESFSSKGLSMFKDISYNASKHVVDINNGKEKNAPFAKSENLAKDKSLFDITKPVAPEAKSSFFEGQKEGREAKLSDTSSENLPNENQIIDINHGKVDKPIFKDLKNLKPKGIIDISKPYYQNAQRETAATNKSLSYEPEIKEPEIATKNLRSGSVVVPNKVQPGNDGESARVHSQITFNENEVALKTSPLAQSSSASETNTNMLTNQESEPITGSITITETQAEAFPKFATQTETKASIAQSTKIEVAIAEKTLSSTLARQESVSLTKARQAIAEAIRQETFYDKSHTESDEQIEQVSKEESRKKKKKTLEESAKEMFHNRKEEMLATQNSEQRREDEGILYFERDNEVNTYRQMAVIAAAERLQSRDGEVTGAKLAEAVTSQVREGKKSEIVDGIQDDETSGRVVNELSHIGRINNSWTLRSVLKQITDRFTAVKLVSESGDGALKEEAEHVYGRQLNGVDARFEEENTTGKIHELENGRVVYVAQSPSHPLPVSPGEVAPQY